MNLLYQCFSTLLISLVPSLTTISQSEATGAFLCSTRLVALRVRRGVQGLERSPISPAMMCVLMYGLACSETTRYSMSVQCNPARLHATARGEAQTTKQSRSTLEMVVAPQERLFESRDHGRSFLIALNQRSSLMFRHSMTCQIGNAKRTLFWNYKWIMECRLLIWFHA